MFVNKIQIESINSDIGLDTIQARIQNFLAKQSTQHESPLKLLNQLEIDYSVSENFRSIDACNQAIEKLKQQLGE